MLMRHAIPLALATIAVAIPAHAQSKPDRLPPKQGIVRVAPPPAQPERTPDRPDRPDRDDHGGRHGTHVGYGYGSRIGSGTAFVAGGGLQSALYVPQQGRMRFALSAPAYVAMFEIQPGRGVRVVFPDDWAAERQLATGFHEPALPSGGDALGGLSSPGTTRWLYLVASDRPLGLVPERRSVGALQALIGANTFQSASTFDVTSALKQRVLAPGGRLTEALVSYRPGIDDVGSAGAGVASVRCPNGVVYSVSAGERFECPR